MLASANLMQQLAEGRDESLAALWRSRVELHGRDIYGSPWMIVGEVTGRTGRVGVSV